MAKERTAQAYPRGLRCGQHYADSDFSRNSAHLCVAVGDGWSSTGVRGRSPRPLGYTDGLKALCPSRTQCRPRRNSREPAEARRADGRESSEVAAINLPALGPGAPGRGKEDGSHSHARAASSPAEIPPGILKSRVIFPGFAQ
jgi:hypothetical protein